MALNQVVVVGANLAGLRSVETLRKEGFEGKIILIGAETHLPYDRPPLSKELLKGDVSKEAVFYHPTEWYEEQQIELLLGVRATGLDLANRRVTHDGGSLSYDGLIVATGSRARTLSTGMDLEGVFVVRTLDDSLSLRAALLPGVRVVVVGAGFIGAEVASSAHALGIHVTVLEAAHTPMQRALGGTMGAALGGLHAENGVELRCGVGVMGFAGNGRVQSVQLSDGSSLLADVVVVGVGVTPNVEWLADSGLRTSNGLVCDAFLNAGAERVYAAGDVVCCRNEWLNCQVRGEQWTTAADQGRLAAQNLLAGEAGHRAFCSAPYFWSDQYGVRIQSIGCTTSGDLVPVMGSPDQRPFVAAYQDDGKIVGAVAINAPRQFAKLRPLVTRKAGREDIESALAAR